MKTTIYDLMGLIKDGKIPKRIKYYNEIFEWNNDEKCFEDKIGNALGQRYAIDLGLTDEVEIIEEEKKIPEKIGLINYSEDPATSIIHNKVNEIIDYLKSKGEE